MNKFTNLASAGRPVYFPVLGGLPHERPRHGCGRKRSASRRRHMPTIIHAQARRRPLFSVGQGGRISSSYQKWGPKITFCRQSSDDGQVCFLRSHPVGCHFHEGCFEMYRCELSLKIAERGDRGGCSAPFPPRVHMLPVRLSKISWGGVGAHYHAPRLFPHVLSPPPETHNLSLIHI